jgi:protocatechuate 3,4-dioxygenase beta subunit
MRRTIMVAALCGLAGVSPAAAQVQPPGQTRPGQVAPQAAPPRPAATGVLRGVVVAADSGTALRRARVTLNAPGLRETRAVTTDLQGRWEFKNLPAGRFTVAASKPQYVTLEYGQRIPTEVGRPIELSAGQVIERIEFRLPRGSVIAGRIVDDLGEPAASIRLQAFRLQYVNGQRRLGPMGGFAVTDDLGQYRLAGLPPGTYYVGSAATIWGGGAPEDVGISFGDTYYPGTLSPNEARAVTVRLGQERLNVDFGLQTVRLASLSGVVIDSEGRPVANSSLTLMQQRQSATVMTIVSTSGVATTAADGRFTVPNVAPGEYSLTSLGTAPRYDVAAERGSVSVTVTGEDVDGLVIALHKGSRVTGQIEFEGETRPALTPAIRIYASEPGGGSGMNLPGTSTINDDWSFEIVGVSPGKRLFRMTGLPATHALKSVFVGDEDVIDTVTPIDGKAPITGVRLVITSRVTAITGGVTDAEGRPVQDYAVVAFASDRARWGPGTRYIATARPDQYGHFTVTGLPPGDYLVAALPYLERGDSEDPEFLSRLEAKATAISLAEGEQKAVDLKVLAPGSPSARVGTVSAVLSSPAG